MDEDTFIEFGLAIVVLFTGFGYIFQGADFITFLITALCFLGIFLFLLGLVQYVAIKKKDNIWAGIVFITIVVVLFGGLPTVVSTFKYIASFIAVSLDKGISYIASLV